MCGMHKQSAMRLSFRLAEAYPLALLTESMTPNLDSLQDGRIARRREQSTSGGERAPPMLGVSLPRVH